MRAFHKTNSRNPLDMERYNRYMSVRVPCYTHAYTSGSWDWFDDFCSRSNARYFVAYARRSNAMTPCVSSWITEGLGQRGNSQ